jgi:energy-coupling factor transporter ATP-binding protein EcfA2
MASGKAVSTREGERLFSEIMYQTTDLGALTVAIYGSLGSGKSTLLRTLAETMRCRDPESGDTQPITIIWRCRDIDIWNSFNKDITYLFIHKDDYPYVRFRTDRLQRLTEKDLPKIITYSTNQDLLSKIVKGSINCIFEPQDYELTEYMIDVLTKKGANRRHLEDPVVDKSAWWIELCVWLLVNKGLDFIAIILDEFDEMMPSGVGGVPWHLGYIFRDYLRVSRKMNISTIMCSHQIRDVNPAILSKILVNVYLKGAIAGGTLINPTAPVTMRRGLGYIERDSWGIFEFSKLKMADKVITTFKQKPQKVISVEDDGAPKEIKTDYFTINATQTDVVFDVNKILEAFGEKGITSDIKPLDVVRDELATETKRFRKSKGFKK